MRDGHRVFASCHARTDKAEAGFEDFVRHANFPRQFQFCGPRRSRSINPTCRINNKILVNPTCVSSITQTDVYPKNVECQTASLESPHKSNNNKQFNIHHLISETGNRSAKGQNDQLQSSSATNSATPPAKSNLDPEGLTVARPWDMNIHKSPLKSTVKKKLFSPAVDLSGTAEPPKPARNHKVDQNISIKCSYLKNKSIFAYACYFNRL